MRSSRDRFGPVSALAVAALLVCSLFIGAPVAQNVELDTGPQLVDVLFDSDVRVAVAVYQAAQAIVAGEELKAYCFEGAAAVDTPTVARDTAENARYESGFRSGVGKRACADELSRDDLMRVRHGRAPHPLRC